MIELLLKLEMSLWIEETRNNQEYMTKVLHNDFIEYGRSGKRYDKIDILSHCDLEINAVFPFPNLSVKEINDNTYLITYQSVLLNGDKIEKSNRSSIWIEQDGTFQLIHHQGTPAEY